MGMSTSTTNDDSPAVPAIAVISLARAGRRKARLRAHLEALGLAEQATWIDAVDGRTLDDEHVRRYCSDAGYRSYMEHPERATGGSMTRGALACALSWKMVLERVTAPTLVLEDDALLHPQFHDRFRTAWRDVPPDWELVYLSCNPYGFAPIGRVLSPSVLRVEARLHGTGALMVHPRAAPKLLSLFPLDRQLDHDLPDKLIVPGYLQTYLLTFHGEWLVKNDNAEGSYTQFGDAPSA